MDVLVVESPAKAKTIGKYLGPGYTVLASYGHVRDLPPKDGSVRPDEDFAMDWEVDSASQKRLDAIAGRGLLLAESPFGTPPIARAFPRRNRIVSGLSAGVIVIEAADRSGSLITAERALDQGREVFVVPGSPMDPRYAGSNTLIRQGAILVRDANDIISVFGMPQSAPQPVEGPREILDDSTTAKVLALLGSVPTAVDELVRRCQVSAATVAEVLTALELEGRLERHRGNSVSLI